MATDSLSAIAFRENVRGILTARRLSIAEVANDTGLSRPGLSRILNGHEAVTIDRAERIAEYLAVPLIELLQQKQEKQRTA